MGLIVSRPEGGDYEDVPTGLHQAVCVRVFDLGLQTGYNNMVQHKVCILWEILERKSNGQRFTVSREFTASLGAKANLTAFLEGWRGRAFTNEELAGFDLDALVGAPCALNLVEVFSQAGKRFVQVQAAMRLLKGQNPLQVETAPNYIPNFIQKKLEARMPEAFSPKYRQGAQQPIKPAPPPPDEFSDDIPF
jgi:hypothetical protein